MPNHVDARVPDGFSCSALSVVGALASALRGKRYVRDDQSILEHLGDAAATSSAVPGEIALDSEVVQ